MALDRERVTPTPAGEGCAARKSFQPGEILPNFCGLLVQHDVLSYGGGAGGRCRRHGTQGNGKRFVLYFGQRGAVVQKGG